MLELTGIRGRAAPDLQQLTWPCQHSEASQPSLLYALLTSPCRCASWVLLAKKDSPKKDRDSLSVLQGLSTLGAIVFESAA